MEQQLKLEDESVFFLDFKLTSLNPDRAKIWGMCALRCLSTEQSVMPSRKIIFRKTENKVKPDIQGYYDICTNSIKDYTYSTHEFQSKVKELFVDNATFIVTEKPEMIKNYFDNTFSFFSNFENINFVYLPNFIRNHITIKTDHGIDDGLEIPLDSDPNFIETCFYAIVDEENWTLHKQNINHILERARKGAILVKELCTYYRLEQISEESEVKNHDDEGTPDVDFR